MGTHITSQWLAERATSWGYGEYKFRINPDVSVLVWMDDERPLKTWKVHLTCGGYTAFLRVVSTCEDVEQMLEGMGSQIKEPANG